MGFVDLVRRKNMSMPVFWDWCWKLLLASLMLIISQVTRANGIADADALYEKCLKDKKNDATALSECKGLYLEALDKEVKEISEKFIARHKDFFTPLNKHSERVLEDIKKGQRKWLEYQDVECGHLLESVSFGTNGPNILHTECRALVLKQRIQLLRHIFCAGDNFQSCKKQWKVEESGIPFNQHMIENMQMHLAKEAEYILELYRRENVNKGLELYQKGDWDDAFKTLQPLAEQGNADAQNLLSIMYFYGRGVQKDERKAFEWLHKAAQQGEVKAQYTLFGMYYEGVAVKQDLAKAEVWLRKAAAQGLPEAQEALARLFGDGKGSQNRRENFDKGLELYKKGDWDGAFKAFQPLAEQGDAIAQNNLGAMYFHGQGVQKDEAKAFEWMHKAAQQGDADAQGALFAMYYEGVGVKQDLAKAEVWLRKAAAQGLPSAQEELEELFGDSKGSQK